MSEPLQGDDHLHRQMRKSLSHLLVDRLALQLSKPGSTFWPPSQCCPGVGSGCNAAVRHSVYAGWHSPLSDGKVLLVKSIDHGAGSERIPIEDLAQAFGIYS